jgi:glycine dehydrogenase subunit 2
MIEPTESESKEEIDYFVEVMKKIAKEAKENPKLVKEASHFTPVKRLDETTAARTPILKWKEE